MLFSACCAWSYWKLSMFLLCYWYKIDCRWIMVVFFFEETCFPFVLCCVIISKKSLSCAQFTIGSVQPYLMGYWWVILGFQVQIITREDFRGQHGLSGMELGRLCLIRFKQMAILFYFIFTRLHWSFVNLKEIHFKEDFSSCTVNWLLHETLNIDVAMPSRYKSDGIYQITACIATSRLHSNSATSSLW